MSIIPVMSGVVVVHLLGMPVVVGHLVVQHTGILHVVVVRVVMHVHIVVTVVGRVVVGGALDVAFPDPVDHVQVGTVLQHLLGLLLLLELKVTT